MSSEKLFPGKSFLLRDFSARPAMILLLLCVAWVRPAAAQPSSLLPPEKVIEVYGQKIHYREAGHGRDVILLHGLGADSTVWTLSILPLAQKYHVVVPDQIGFGHSDKPLIEYKIETFTSFLLGFMQALKIPNAALVGNSMGGWIAADFAVSHPQMVSQLVLVDAAGLRIEAATPLPTDLNVASLDAMRKVMEVVFYHHQFINDSVVAAAFEQKLKSGDGYTVERVLSGWQSKDQFEDEKLPRIKSPTLIIWGREDALTPLALGQMFQKGIPGSKLVIVENSGHLPQVENSAEFNPILMKFLDTPTAAAAPLASPGSTPNR